MSSHKKEPRFIHLCSPGMLTLSLAHGEDSKNVWATEIGWPSLKQWASLVAQKLESACYAGDLGSIPGSGRSPGEGNGNPLQYSCLENPMDRGAWWATVHRVTELDRTERLPFPFHFL